MAIVSTTLENLAKTDCLGLCCQVALGFTQQPLATHRAILDALLSCVRGIGGTLVKKDCECIATFFYFA